MSVIKIKSFGPIGVNSKSDDGLFTVNFSPVTVFIGHQASGKSTLAKLFSTFAWIEKTLVRGDISISNINNSNFQNLCKNQEILEYFNTDTKIICISSRYNFEYENGTFKVVINNNCSTNYILPKIQYISAARNLLTILHEISNDTIIQSNGSTVEILSYIPTMVKQLNEEYTKSLSQLKETGFEIPIDETSVFYKDRKTFIKTKNKQISMSAASSGIQSITPLLMVSSFLAKEVQKSWFDKLQPVSLILKKRIENKILETKNEKLLEIFNLCQIYGEESLPADLTNDEKTLQQLSNILKQFLPSCFINIVEEPEQNLFPTTQAQVLYELLKYKNENENNKLIITTHSPYILTSLNNAIFAKDVFNKQHKYIEELSENKMVSFEDISAYKLEEGNIISIRDEETRLINAYQIDDCSIQIDENFSKLSELMEQNND